MTNINIHTTSPSREEDLRIELPQTEEVVAVSLVEDNSSLNHVAMFERFLSNRTSYTNARDALVAVAAILNQVQADSAKAETDQAKLNQDISTVLTKNAVDNIKKVLDQVEKFLNDVEQAREEQNKQQQLNGILNIIFGVVEMIVGALTSNPAMIFAGALQLTIGTLMVTNKMEDARNFIASGFEALGMEKEDAKLAADLLIFATVVLGQFMATGGILGFVEGLITGTTMSQFLIQDLAKHIVNQYYANLSEEEKANKEQEIQESFGKVLMALTILTAAARIVPGLVKGGYNMIKNGKVMETLTQLRQSITEFFTSAGSATQSLEAAASQKTLWEKCKEFGTNMKFALGTHPQLFQMLIQDITSISIGAANATSQFKIANLKKEQASIKRYWALLEAELSMNSMVMKTTQEIGQSQVQDFSNRLDSHRRMIGEVLNAIDTEGSSYVQAMQA